jgi:hypothetical protein
MDMHIKSFSRRLPLVILLYLLGQAAAFGNILPPSRGICDGVLFRREVEAREAAFSYLIPDGWISSGGMVRRDPLATGTNPDSVAVKMDFQVQLDSLGRALIRWMPNITYFDIGCSAVYQDAQLFPPGSSYQGMLVYPLMPAGQYITNLLIPVAHPYAGNIQIITEHSLQNLADQYSDRSRDPFAAQSVSHTAATLTLSYEENGITYKERWLAVVEDPGEIGGGQWTNRETVYFRAPFAEFDSLEAIFEVIHNSIVPDPIWTAHELRHKVMPVEVSLRTRYDDRQIGEQRMSDHIQSIDNLHGAMFTNPVDTLQVVNPFDHALEFGSAHWRNMWMNGRGDILYTDDDGCDPNRESNVDRREFRRCVLPNHETSMLLKP